LTLLVYKVEHDILQAGEYGTPQSRRRLIIWGALQGYELPKYPEATTTFRRTDSWHQTRESVPHRGYTVGDATSDLPPFDWINPHNVIPASDKENEERATRSKQGIEQLEVSQDQKYVGHDEQSYATSPLNDFQRKLRVGVTKATNHVTPSWFDKPSWNEKGAISLARTEQVCNIAMRAGADHRSLPKKLTPWSLSHLRESSIERTRGQYGRLDSDKPFHCCTTIADPSQRDCRVRVPIISCNYYLRD
jgi:DNA (cytosine-5)-methyltransferase 1